MDPLKIVCWKWTDLRWPHAYSAERVNILADMVSRNLKIPHQILCITDNACGIAEGIGIIPLWEDFAALGHCYRRLRAFAADMESIIGKRFLSLDLDTVITGDLTELFSTTQDFVIAKDTQPPTPYNGSLFLMNAGCRRQVFETFDPIESPRIGARLGYAACDQAWIAACLGPKEKTWDQSDGLYSYKNDLLRNHAGHLPANAKLVFFHGDPKPWDLLEKHAPANAWVKKHYRRNRRGLLVLGGAACVWDDLKKVDRSQFDIMAVNDMGYTYEDRIDYWVTLHPENLAGWKAKRKGNVDYESWSHAHLPVAKLNKVLVDYWRSTLGLSGSSGLFAAQVALSLGYDYVLLAGVPMDGQPNQTGPKKCWNTEVAENFRLAWSQHADKLRGKVFSLSGWTRELLGFKELEL